MMAEPNEIFLYLTPEIVWDSADKCHAKICQAKVYVKYHHERCSFFDNKFDNKYQGGVSIGFYVPFKFILYVVYASQRYVKKDVRLS